MALNAQASALPGFATKDPLRLCPCVRARYQELRERGWAGTLALTLIETLRDATREQHYVDTGVSRTMHSMHLPQPPNGLALAFDACPTAYLTSKLWNPSGPLWAVYGELVRAVGLEWGGDWQGWKDLSHAQLRRCACPIAVGVPA